MGDGGMQFSTMLRKMADEWEAMVTTARMRRQAQEIAEKDKEREIQKQERLEWGRYLRGILIELFSAPYF